MEMVYRQGGKHMKNTEALYQQIHDRLLEEINAGVYQAGEYLPPLPKICAQFGAGVATARRALHSWNRRVSCCTEAIGAILSIRRSEKSSLRKAIFGGNYLSEPRWQIYMKRSPCCIPAC